MAEGVQQTGKEQGAGSWQYKPQAASDTSFVGSTNQSPPSVSAADSVVEWSASEFVAHEKSFSWYALLTLGTLVVAALMYLIIRDVVSVVVILFFGVVIGVMGGRKPRVVAYRLSAAGVHIGARFHPYSEYKSFTLRNEGPFVSIELLPMKRFDFPLSIYLAPDNQNKVLDELSRHLPLEPSKPGGIEQLMHRLRF